MRRGRIRRFVSVLIVDIFMVISICPVAQAQESGEAIFARICKACHTVGQGKLVGPDLAGITQRRDVEWIIPFVQSSQSVINSGDPDAVKIFEEFNKLIMPDNPLGRGEVLEVIRYIEATAGDPSTLDEVRPTPLDTATDEDLARGAALFQGIARLEAGGPACNSCHHVHQRGVMGGGLLARDLTKVVSRMGAPGVQAILANPPFPVMAQAYTGHALSDDEVFALTAFLQKLDQDQPEEVAGTYGLQIFFIGLTGAGLLTVLYAMIWMGRKKAMIYKDIHRRQLNS